MTNLSRLTATGALVPAIGVGIPLLERWYLCRQPTSEACVWAKAYLELSFGLWTALGVAVAVVVWFVFAAYGRKR